MILVSIWRSGLSKDQSKNSDSNQTGDKFIAMVTAKARADLAICDFEPRAMLATAVHDVRLPRFPAIDCHNHLDSLDPAAVLRIMDECGIEHTVNITMKVGDEAFRVMDKFAATAPRHFSTIGWMDWSGLDRPDFFLKAVEYLERLVE